MHKTTSTIMQVDIGLVVLLVAAAVTAAPRPDGPEEAAAAVGTAATGASQSHLDVVMVTQSPAEAIEDAIRYDPDVAAALKNNDTQLYLLKSVTYTNGTAEDLGLPKEELLPGGAPDRVKVADKIVYSANDSTNTTQSAASSVEQPSGGVHATVQLVPVAIN